MNAHYQSRIITKWGIILANIVYLLSCFSLKNYIELLPNV